MDNQELLTQIAQMMEDQTRSLREEMSSMEERMDQKMSSMEDRIGQKIDQAIAKNNVAIAELVNEALEPIYRDIREIKEDAALLRADNAKNTLDIARLKLAK